MPKTLRGIGYRNSFASGVGSGSGLARGVRALNGFHEDEADPGRLLVLPATSTAFDGGAE
ncbi:MULTISPECIES: hypothetical protein [unclassified Nocardia]|uniref:hypothetical protein n=1 Tax=unclassified Nocardia TaxID=2637762 RepID=UPI0034217DE1